MSGFRSSGADPTTGAFYLSVVEACLHLGLEGLLVQTHPMIMTRIMELGWEVEPLALPTEYEGKPLVPLYAGLTRHTLATSRAVFGIQQAVLEIEGVTAPRRRNDLPGQQSATPARQAIGT